MDFLKVYKTQSKKYRNTKDRQFIETIFIITTRYGYSHIDDWYTIIKVIKILLIMGIFTITK